MTLQTGTILDKIAAHKREELETRRSVRPLFELRADVEAASAPRDFAAALGKPGISLIAEIKRASPSRGPLRPNLDPAGLAGVYAANGAAAISVLTDERFFQGSLDDLRVVRRAGSVPVLRKDFLLDPYQLYEARVAGADAALLIVAILDDALLSDLLALAKELALAALVEVHTMPELERALAFEPEIIGINNRNLHTFEVNLGTTAELRSHIPDETLVVAESGIAQPADVARLRAIGVDAMLVGTALVTVTDPGTSARRLAAAGAGIGRGEGAAS
ncbi:MAG: indole-3-glycerol phosphate synthase TrpC [Anaerolineae bacterium]